MHICIAGKNICAIEALKFLINLKVKKEKLLALPNHNDNGEDSWQPSFMKYAKKNKIRIPNLKKLHSMKNLIFFSLEYEKIINTRKFMSDNLFNLHFSLLPKYRGCHTNFLQIYNGEKYSGVTLHKIDNGIDTGDIIDQIKFKIKINDTAYNNYIKLMKFSIKLFKRNFNKIANKKYRTRKQILSNGNYFSRKSVDYKKKKKIKMKKFSLLYHNRIRSIIFPPYQYPIVNGFKIIKSVYKNKKIYLTRSSDYKSK